MLSHVFKYSLSAFFLFTFYPIQQSVVMNSLGRDTKMKMNTAENVTITVIYDNNSYQKNLQTAWGFSCLVKTSTITLLFDTGGDGSILMGNMQKLDIDPQEIDVVFLSHFHGDHCGGIYKFLETNPAISVYLPQSFPKEFKVNLATYGAKIVDVNKSVKIAENIFSSGEIGSEIIEQSLIILTPKGQIVITGCAHPGIVQIVQRAQELFVEPILLVMGGFHLVGKSKANLSSIISTLKSLGIQYAAPCHCSGDMARRKFSQEFGQAYLNFGVGKIINLEDLK